MARTSIKILFVASEAFPLMKTGGLGDVCGALPPALQALGAEPRLLMPAYRETRASAGPFKTAAEFEVPPTGMRVRLLEGRLPGTRVPVWLVDFAPAFDRDGHPYHDARGNPWPDNAARFVLLARVACLIAQRRTPLSWQPDIVHCHDWQTALVPALLSLESPRPATVFTIHNLAYQGLFDRDTFGTLGLPPSWWSLDALEFHGQLSFIKGGIVFADRVTTVSPNYAREIQTPEYGYGLDGLLRHRAAHLNGILNGVDDTVWNPARDPLLAARYSARTLAVKQKNKTALRKRFGLKEKTDTLLVGMVGRMVHQKGVDLVAAALPQLMQQDVQFAILGTGEPSLERALSEASAKFPGRCGTIVGYDEKLAHRIVAGADAFLMPSRFEPCGLSQLYALRYGTIPVVRRVGGLADTVSDGATGVVFDAADADAVVAAVTRAQLLQRDRARWRKLQLAAMRQDFSWRHSAKDYLGLYRGLS